MDTVSRDESKFVLLPCLVEGNKRRYRATRIWDILTFYQFINPPRRRRVVVLVRNHFNKDEPTMELHVALPFKKLFELLRKERSE